MSAEFFSFSNPVFSNFAFYAGVVLCKTMLMSGLTALHRIKNEVCVYIHVKRVNIECSKY